MKLFRSSFQALLTVSCSGKSSHKTSHSQYDATVRRKDMLQQACTIFSMLLVLSRLSNQLLHQPTHLSVRDIPSPTFKRYPLAILLEAISDRLSRHGFTARSKSGLLCYSDRTVNEAKSGP
jgi:hypothetical protein